MITVVFEDYVCILWMTKATEVNTEYNAESYRLLMLVAFIDILMLCVSAIFQIASRTFVRTGNPSLPWVISITIY